MAIEANYLSVTLWGSSSSLVNNGLKVAQVVDADNGDVFYFKIDGTHIGWDYDSTTDRVELYSSSGDVMSLTRVGDRWRYTVGPDDFRGPSVAPGSTFTNTCQFVVTRTTALDTVTNAPTSWTSPSFTVTVDRKSRWSPDRVSGLQAWYDAYTFFSTANAASLASWDDKGPYGFDLAQATGGMQPQKYVDGTGRPYVLFDGTDDNMLTAAQSLGGDQFGLASTVIAAMEIDSYDPAVRGVVQVGGTNGARIAFNSTNLKGATGADIANTSLPALDASFVATVTKTASGAVTVKRGLNAAVSQASVNAVTPGVIQIGDTAADTAAAFRLYELLVFDSVLSAENQAQAIRYMQKKWAANG